MAIIKLTKDSFNKEVMISDKPVLIDFYADWCGPCKMAEPIIEDIERDHPEIKVCKVNVDKERELANKFNISSIPTFVAMEDGNRVDSITGFLPRKYILNMFGIKE